MNQRYQEAKGEQQDERQPVEPAAGVCLRHVGARSHDGSESLCGNPRVALLVSDNMSRGECARHVRLGFYLHRNMVNAEIFPQMVGEFHEVGVARLPARGDHVACSATSAVLIGQMCKS
jgi:hypothetical protein